MQSGRIYVSDCRPRGESEQSLRVEGDGENSDIEGVLSLR